MARPSIEKWPWVVGEVARPAGAPDLEARRANQGASRGAERVGVEADAACPTAPAHRLAVAERQRHRVVGVAGHDQRRRRSTVRPPRASVDHVARASPSRFAVAGERSAALSQVSFVIGSGAPGARRSRGSGRRAPCSRATKSTSSAGRRRGDGPDRLGDPRQVRRDRLGARRGAGHEPGARATRPSAVERIGRAPGSCRGGRRGAGAGVGGAGGPKPARARQPSRTMRHAPCSPSSRNAASSSTSVRVSWSGATSGWTMETVPSRARRSPQASSGWLAASRQRGRAHRLVVAQREHDRVRHLAEERAQARGRPARCGAGSRR